MSEMRTKHLLKLLCSTVEAHPLAKISKDCCISVSVRVQLAYGMNMHYDNL